MLHKGRHVVVADLPEDVTALTEGGTVQVLGRVAVAEGVEGKARRGRPPQYTKPVPVADLELLDHASCSEKVLADAAALVAGPPTTETTEDDSATESE